MVELPCIVGKVQDLRLRPVTLKKKKKKGGEKERLFSSWICFAFLKQNNSGFYLLEICLVKKYLMKAA